MAFSLEENTGCYLNDGNVCSSLPCVGSPEAGAACHTIAKWLKMVPFAFFPDRKYIIYLMGPCTK